MDKYTEEREDHFLLFFIIFTVLFLIGAVLLGSLGNLYIGAVAVVISIPLLLTGILQLNKIIHFAYGSLLVYVAAASMRNYKDGIHNPVALYKKYAAIGINRSALNAIITVWIIFFIMDSKGKTRKMFSIWNFIISFIVGGIGYLLAHDLTVALFLLAITMLLIRKLY